MPKWHVSYRGAQDGIDSQLWIMWYLQVVFSMIICVLSVVVLLLFAHGAAWSPIAMAVTSGCLAFILWVYEPWAVKRKYHFHVYVAMCLYYLIMSALTVFSGWCLVQIASVSEDACVLLLNIRRLPMSVRRASSISTRTGFSSKTRSFHLLPSWKPSANFPSSSAFWQAVASSSWF